VTGEAGDQEAFRKALAMIVDMNKGAEQPRFDDQMREDGIDVATEG